MRYERRVARAAHRAVHFGFDTFISSSAPAPRTSCLVSSKGRQQARGDTRAVTRRKRQNQTPKYADIKCHSTDSYQSEGLYYMLVPDSSSSCSIEYNIKQQEKSFDDKI